MSPDAGTKNQIVLHHHQQPEATMPVTCAVRLLAFDVRLGARDDPAYFAERLQYLGPQGSRRAHSAFRKATRGQGETHSALRLGQDPSLTREEGRRENTDVKTPCWML
jgi:hypothetical protein